MSWDGIDLALLGMWKTLADGHPLAKHVRGIDPSASLDDPDRFEVCVDNVETVRYYQSTEASLNLYRRESERPDLVDGWAMGPREVELAACGTFFATEPRGENELVLPFVPKVSSPGEAEECLRWYLAHDDERARVARQAREAVQGWTFENRAAEVLRLLDSERSVTVALS
jgi:spore maturation protein CgeB